MLSNLGLILLFEQVQSEFIFKIMFALKIQYDQKQFDKLGKKINFKKESDKKIDS